MRPPCLRCRPTSITPAQSIRYLRQYRKRSYRDVRVWARPPVPPVHGSQKCTSVPGEATLPISSPQGAPSELLSAEAFAEEWRPQRRLATSAVTHDTHLALLIAGRI